MVVCGNLKYFLNTNCGCKRDIDSVPLTLTNQLFLTLIQWFSPALYLGSLHRLSSPLSLLQKRAESDVSRLSLRWRLSGPSCVCMQNASSSVSAGRQKREQQDTASSAAPLPQCATNTWIHSNPS